jgi:hypothetical protein
MLSGGKHAARKLKRAQILLAADRGISDEAIARSVGVGGSTVYRTKRRFVEGNLELALAEDARPGAARKPGAQRVGHDRALVPDPKRVARSKQVKGRKIYPLVDSGRLQEGLRPFCRAAGIVERAFH